MLNAATPDFVKALAAHLPQGALRAPEPRDLTEPRGRWQGQAGIVARPGTVEEVAAVVRACAEAQVGIVPWGGGTGLVGGQVMGQGPLPVLLSLERMAAVRAVHTGEGVMIAEAGATLAAVRAAADAAGRLFPLSLASEGTATIGGNLATNAGGVNVLRYGNARDLCLGLEAVLADGTIWHGLKRLRKDNTGYDLRNLLIGAEGTLGIITAASLRLFPRPAGVGTALLAVPSPEAALALLSLAQERMAGLVSAFELIGRAGFEFLDEAGFDLRMPLASLPDWAVLIEIGLPASLDAEAALAGLYEAAGDLVADGVIAQGAAQRDALWALRETIPLANRRVGAVASHDISLPLSQVAGFIERAGRLIAAMGDMRVNCFGHMGDGNLHYNVFPARGRARAEYDNQRAAVTVAVHDLADAMGGSVSAEHGIGRAKVADLARYGDPAKLAAMRAIKTALDPLGILNPGAVLPGQAALP